VGANAAAELARMVIAAMDFIFCFSVSVFETMKMDNVMSVSKETFGKVKE
jgi:hypothetical protein